MASGRDTELLGRGHGATRAWPVSLAALAGGERPAAVTHRERDVRCRRRPSRVVHRCGFRLWGHVSAGLAARAWTPAPEAGAARITEPGGGGGGAWESPPGAGLGPRGAARTASAPPAPWRLLRPGRTRGVWGWAAVG